MHQFHKDKLLTIICCVVFGVNVIFHLGVPADCRLFID